jgi:hypothetical protein
MNIAGYRINFDALLARLVYRWRYQTLAGLVLLLILGGVLSGVIPPFWNGRAELTILAVPEATVLVDGRAWPRPIYAGAHHLQATMLDGRSAWADIALQSGAALTVTLPAGLPTPIDCSVPAAAPGTPIDQVWSIVEYSEEDWQYVLRRWEAIRAYHRQYILDHPGCIAIDETITDADPQVQAHKRTLRQRLDRQQWLSRLLVATPRILAAAEYARIRRQIEPADVMLRADQKGRGKHAR